LGDELTELSAQLRQKMSDGGPELVRDVVEQRAVAPGCHVGCWASGGGGEGPHACKGHLQVLHPGPGG
jgi:hypothetical protein